MNSERLRTIQLNVCNGEEVEKAVEAVRSSLKDPEKGRWWQGLTGAVCMGGGFLNATCHLLACCP